MKLFSLGLALALLFSVDAFAAKPKPPPSNCHWVVEGNFPPFNTDSVYGVPPKIVGSAACSTAGAKAMCMGFAYCEYNDDTVEPLEPVVCPADKLGDKWKCPTAKKCYDDVKVALRYVKVPEKSAPLPAKGNDPGGRK